ncbi:MAG: hypothetical protein KTQ49_08130 [Candidatus Omnitrophica bacterium]|nr:hypothetical protein [Candidatus Omnitrophota bacterium]
MRKNSLLAVLLAILLLLAAVPSVHAGTGHDIAYAMRGIGKIFGGVFAIPKAMIQDSGRVLFPFGIVTGALRGTVETVTGVLGGTFDIARGAAPYAKYAALAL